MCKCRVEAEELAHDKGTDDFNYDGKVQEFLDTPHLLVEVYPSVHETTVEAISQLLQTIKPESSQEFFALYEAVGEETLKYIKNELYHDRELGGEV